jgi:phytoene dehydrogenase-like protein
LKPHSKIKTLVVGAGGGGIASALLARLRGEEVTLLEAHSALGGCASWFRRGLFIFDAGATTISGVADGEPLGELFSKLGSAPDLFPVDPGITFHLSSGKVIRYHRDFELWMNELSHNFPSMNHRPFWTRVRKINMKSWALLKDLRTFPFVQLSDITSALKHPRYLKLVPYLFISTEQALKSAGLDHPDYLELVNGILFISAQATSEHIPFIVGAMALSYPAETFAPVGGMKGLMDYFEKELKRLGVEVRTRVKVKNFEPKKVITSWKKSRPIV